MNKLLFIGVCVVTIALSAHEFIQKPKAKAISLSSLKKKIAQEFSEQLHLSADAVQKIGALQQKVSGDVKIDESIEMKKIAARMFACNAYYGNILSEPIVIPEQIEEVSLAYIVELLGAIQKKILDHLEDIFEDKGSVFVQKQKHRLSGVLQELRLYTGDFNRLQRALSGFEQKPSAIRVCKAKPVAQQGLA
jgi:hypothetical protein